MPNPNGYTPNLKHYKPKWNSGKTRTIRVPVVLADQILDYAYQVDNGISPDTSGNRGKYEAVTAILEEALKLKANAGGAIKAEIRKALEILK